MTILDVLKMILLKLKSLDKFIFYDLQIDKTKHFTYSQLKSFILSSGFTLDDFGKIDFGLFNAPGVLVDCENLKYIYLDSSLKLDGSSLFFSMFKKLNKDVDVGLLDIEYENNLSTAISNKIFKNL